MITFALGLLAGVYLTVAAYRYGRETEDLRDPSFREQLTATGRALAWPWHAVQTIRDIWREES